MRHQSRSSSNSCGDRMAKRTFALLHPDYHALRIYIADLQRDDLHVSQPCAVGNAESRLVLGRCVSAVNLRTLMSSSIHWRSGLMGFSLIGGSRLEVGVLGSSILKTERPLRYPRSINGLPRPAHAPNRAAAVLPRERVRSLAESGLAALGNQNVEPDILVCIVAWLLSTPQSGPSRRPLS